MRRIERKRKPNIAKKKPSKEPFFKGVQKKVAIGEPNDHYEKEADVMADAVTKGGNASSRVTHKTDNQNQTQSKPLASQITPLVQRSSEEEAQTKLQRQEEEEATQAKLQRQEEELEAAQPKLQLMEEEEEAQTKLQRQEEEEAQPKLQRQEGEEEAQTKLQRQEEEEAQPKLQRAEEEEVQAKQASQATVKPTMEATLKSKKGSGSKMDSKTKNEMESGFGADFSGVNIHTDKASQEMNQEIGAQAFTHGNDVYFNEGKYKPQSQEGRHLLAHELTHTIQQKGAKQIQRQDNPPTTSPAPQTPPKTNTPAANPTVPAPAKTTAQNSTLFADAMTKLKTISPLCHSYLSMTVINGSEVEIKKESHTGLDLVYKFELATFSSSGGRLALFTDVDINLDQAASPPKVISRTKIELDASILTAASTPTLVDKFAQDMYHECMHLLLNIDLIRNTIANDASQDTSFTKEFNTYKTAAKGLAEYLALELDIAAYILTKAPGLPTAEANKLAAQVIPLVLEERFVIGKAEKSFGGSSTNLQIAATYLLDSMTQKNIPASISSPDFMKLVKSMTAVLDKADKAVAPKPKKTP